MDLIATHLDAHAVEEVPEGATTKVRHFIVQPGVASTNISSSLVTWFTDPIRVLSFYLARLLNSPNHTIEVYKAAISVVHLSLISLAFFPAFSSLSSKSTTDGTANGHAKKPQPGRFGSETDRWGTERVGWTPVVEWEKYEEQGRELLEKCDELYQQFLETEETAHSQSC